jgi:hypothetical protein
VAWLAESQEFKQVMLSNGAAKNTVFQMAISNTVLLLHFCLNAYHISNREIDPATGNECWATLRLVLFSCCCC